METEPSTRRTYVVSPYADTLLKRLVLAVVIYVVTAYLISPHYGYLPALELAFFSWLTAATIL